MVVPFINQIAVLPSVVLRQTRSALLSPFTSPTPPISNAVDALPGKPTPVILNPFISHTATVPLVPLRQMTSPLPSPFTSPTPAIFQATGTPPGKPVAAIVVPFINQIAVLPWVFCQIRSVVPDASRSAKAGVPV